MQIEKDSEVIEESEDWAVLPFDEAEDDARWTRLIEETEELIKEAEEMEAVHGELLMENKLSELELTEKQPEDVPF
jgi:hypothetical protein